MVVNTYAPATYKDNVKFFPKLTRKIREIQKKYSQQIILVVGGDMNGTIDNS